MDSTVPAVLLKLKYRLEAWRATRKYKRQPIPDEFRQAAAEMAKSYSPSLVRRILKLDPWRLKNRRLKGLTAFIASPRPPFSLCRPTSR
jgi:hypothetical protein